jgi:hypothetical protein
MSEQITQKSTVQKIKELPIASGAIAVTSALSLTEVFNAGVLLFAAPLASAVVGVSGGINAFDKKRSGLSRAFSAAAAGVGIFGAALPFLIAGPGALGAIAVSLITATAAGAFNVAAYLLRNKKMPSLALPKSNTSAPQP